MKEEKKVEYLELVYDLIFVYVIGRNNSLLHHVDGGFVSMEVFLAYVLSTLAVIQIWNFSTFYINMYGRNGIRDHISLLLNMYLLYYIGEGTRTDWFAYQNQYHIAWTLILINIGIQYCIERKNHPDDPEILRSIQNMTISLFGEAAIVLIAIPIFNVFGVQIALLGILYGIIVTWVLSDGAKAELIDFPHLTERAMLYVVFSFGEMIIATAEYFEGDFDLNSVYFSLMCFLIVVALFLSYEFLYDKIIDRERKTTGMLYMVIHIFLVFSMNNITVALEFMRDDAVALLPKLLFLVISLLLYFLCILGLLGYAKLGLSVRRQILLRIVALSVAFLLAMLLFASNMYLNIAISVVYVYAIFIAIHRYRKQENGFPYNGGTA